MFVFPPSEETNQFGTTDIQRVRLQNASVIARLIWNAPEGLSRAEVARRTGLSASTVSAIVSDLLTEGLLLTSRTARSSGGRPPVVLEFNTQRNHVLGVSMGASHVAVVLCDLMGAVTWQRSVDYDVPGDPPGTLRLMSQLIREAQSHPMATGDLLGIGVGVPCPIDATTPDQLSPRLLPQWVNVHLAAELYRRVGVRVLMDNDANCAAVAEATTGAGRDITHFTYIKVATGVGAGHIIDSRPFHGYTGIAGEIGHTTVDPNGRLCRCGLHGCLEAEIGSIGLVEKAREALARGQASCLADAEPLRLADIVQGAVEGDALCGELIDEAGHYLGIAVANLLNLMNPARIVIGGQLAIAGDRLLTPLRRCVRDRALWTSVERAEVILSPFTMDPTAIGAAMLVLRAALADLSQFRGDVLGASGAPTGGVPSRGGLRHA